MIIIQARTKLLKIDSFVFKTNLKTGLIVWENQNLILKAIIKMYDLFMLNYVKLGFHLSWFSEEEQEALKGAIPTYKNPIALLVDMLHCWLVFLRIVNGHCFALMVIASSHYLIALCIVWSLLHHQIVSYAPSY
jgi:hypothetical protein